MSEKSLSVHHNQSSACFFDVLPALALTYLFNTTSGERKRLFGLMMTVAMGICCFFVFALLHPFIMVMFMKQILNLLGESSSPLGGHVHESNSISVSPQTTVSMTQSNHHRHQQRQQPQPPSPPWCPCLSHFFFFLLYLFWVMMTVAVGICCFFVFDLLASHTSFSFSYHFPCGPS